MRQTLTLSNVQIVAPAAVTYDSLAFSSDGNYVYYALSGQEFPQRVLHHQLICGSHRRPLTSIYRRRGRAILILCKFSLCRRSHTVPVVSPASRLVFSLVHCCLSITLEAPRDLASRMDE